MLEVMKKKKRLKLGLAKAKKASKKRAKAAPLNGTKFAKLYERESKFFLQILPPV